MTSIFASLTVAALLAVNNDPQTQPVQTVKLRGNELYAIKIRRGLTVVRFPFRCTTNWLSDTGIVEANLSTHGLGVLNIKGLADAPIGASVDATLICDPSLAISLHMTVAETQETSPRIDFVWSDEDLSIHEQRHQQELADMKADGDQRVQDARASRQPDIQYILSHARRAFGKSTRRDSGRSGSVAVHVDHEKRLGDLGIIEFRIVNRERLPVRVNRIEVSGVGSSAATASFAVGDDEDVDIQNTVGGALLTDPFIAPGATVEASVGFPWPGDTSRFKLTVHLNAPDARDVEVRNIDF